MSFVFRADFCSGVAVRLTVICGSFSRRRSCNGVPVVLTTLASIREVSMPSPVDSPGKMMWPDCSPPILMSSSRMAAATLESPTEVISVLTLCDLAQFRRP